MSFSISTLLIRNLHDVFGENDPRVGARPSTRSSRRLRVLRAQWHPPWPRRDRSRRGAVKATHPDFRYQPIAGPEEWATAGGSDGIGPPGEAPLTPALFLIARDGRIAAVYLFFDKLP